MEGAKSNGIDASLLCSNQEEADTLLIFHALQIAGKIAIMTLFNYCTNIHCWDVKTS